ncbi:MAG: hypothetical protein WB441_03905 [Nocardioidaceae bacterium]
MSHVLVVDDDHTVRETSDVPVVMLTAFGSETDRVVGLERCRRLRH